MQPIEITPVDRRIWEEELDGFVPRRVYDVHTHLYRWAFNRNPDKDSSPYAKLLGSQWADATARLADACDALLMPGREVHRLSFPFPFPDPCDFAASNQFVADQTRGDSESAALMLVHPHMQSDAVEQEVDRHGFVGFKPYRFYASSGDAVNCRLTDFMPEALIQLADRRGLLIMMHLAKKNAVADAENLADLLRLSQKYPRARWILAHCARSYSSWPIERAAGHLRGLANVWYDTSSVCESDAIEALYQAVGLDRVMYGSDDLPVGVLRGKYIAFGFAWAYLSPANQTLELSHCEGAMTFTRYEQLRAMQRAGKRLGLGKEEHEKIFYRTAAELVRAVRGEQAVQKPT
jgi:glutamate-1-semialdehyde 2,1-aminomutase